MRAAHAHREPDIAALRDRFAINKARQFENNLSAVFIGQTEQARPVSVGENRRPGGSVHVPPLRIFRGPIL